MRLDGTQAEPLWRVIAGPKVGDYSELASMAAASAKDAWAVGYSGNNGEYPTALILHWDGVQWSVATVPESANIARLNGVAVAAADDIWAVGETSGNHAVTAKILHWDGARWEEVSFSGAGGSYQHLNGVTALSAHEAWAVGSVAWDDTAPVETMVLHWDGASWVRLPSPGSSDAQLFAVSATGPGSADVWAVGELSERDTASHQALIERWDGSSRSWRMAQHIDNESGPNRLRGVLAVSGSDIWAVGDMLIERYYDPCAR